MRRLYRVTGVWVDGRTEVRHYMTKKAADHRAAVFRDGRKALETYDHMNGAQEVVGPITAAETVTVEASDPITWPEQPKAQRADGTWYGPTPHDDVDPRMLS